MYHLHSPGDYYLMTRQRSFNRKPTAGHLSIKEKRLTQLPHSLPVPIRMTALQHQIDKSIQAKWINCIIFLYLEYVSAYAK